MRVAVVTNVVPHYREEFYRRVFQCADLDVRVYCQNSIPGMGLKLVHDRFPERVTLVASWSMKGEALAWQALPWRKLLDSYDVVFVYGNPRILSNVLLSVLARAFRRPTVIWGQAHGARSRSMSEALRLWWWRGFRNLFVYTDREALWLREERGFAHHHVVGMNNGLDQMRIDGAVASWDDRRLAEWRERQCLTGRTLALSCARLEPERRFDLWLDAIPSVKSRYPGLLWCVIGDGPERAALEARTRALGLESNVRWIGAVFDEADLASWFLSSSVLVHPGSIGLTLLHAFGYGLPVITHDDAASQTPEFGAFEAGRTGLLFRRGDAASLSEAVIRCLSDEPARRRMGERGRQIARQDYNVAVMAERFVAMAKQAGARG
jgi:glycosyltransferase involved in cell wall biosynthesis